MDLIISKYEIENTNCCIIEKSLCENLDLTNLFLMLLYFLWLKSHMFDIEDRLFCSNL